MAVHFSCDVPLPELPRYPFLLTPLDSCGQRMRQQQKLGVTTVKPAAWCDIVSLFVAVRSHPLHHVKDAAVTLSCRM